MKKLLSTAAVLIALTGAANASIIAALGNDPNTNIGRTPGAGAFDDQYTFTLSTTQTVLITAILNTYPLGPNSSAFISSFTGSVVEGTPGSPGATVVGPTFASTPCGPLTNCQSLGGQATLNAGAYFLDFSGVAGSTAAYGGTVNTVPVPGPRAGSFTLGSVLSLLK